MTQTKKDTVDGGVLGRLAGRGEEALRRLYDELDRNARTHEALERLLEARGRLDKVQRSVLHQLNLAPADEVEKLRKEIARLERRLAKVEGVAAKPAPRRTRKTAAPAGGENGPGLAA